MPTQRRRGRLDGETRTKRTPTIDWAPSELAIIEAAAEARGQSPTTFIAQAALGVASGRFGVVTTNGVHGLTPELVAVIREISAGLIEVRRLMANASGSLNQLAAAANSGAAPTTAAVESAARYLHEQLGRHDEMAARLLDVIEPD